MHKFNYLQLAQVTLDFGTITNICEPTILSDAINYHKQRISMLEKIYSDGYDDILQYNTMYLINAIFYNTLKTTAEENLIDDNLDVYFTDDTNMEDGGQSIQTIIDLHTSRIETIMFCTKLYPDYKLETRSIITFHELKMVYERNMVTVNQNKHMRQQKSSLIEPVLAEPFESLQPSEQISEPVNNVRSRLFDPTFHVDPTFQVTALGIQRLKDVPTYHLSDLDLHTLNLAHNTNITNCGLEHLKGMKYLKGLPTNPDTKDISLEHLKGYETRNIQYVNGLPTYGDINSKKSDSNDSDDSDDSDDPYSQSEFDDEVDDESLSEADTEVDTRVNTDVNIDDFMPELKTNDQYTLKSIVDLDTLKSIFDLESESETEIDTESETETETEIDTESESETESNSGSDAGSLPEHTIKQEAVTTINPAVLESDDDAMINKLNTNKDVTRLFQLFLQEKQDYLKNINSNDTASINGLFQMFLQEKKKFIINK